MRFKRAWFRALLRRRIAVIFLLALQILFICYVISSETIAAVCFICSTIFNYPLVVSARPSHRYIFSGRVILGAVPWRVAESAILYGSMVSALCLAAKSGVYV